jgi:hypothetical protein
LRSLRFVDLAGFVGFADATDAAGDAGAGSGSGGGAGGTAVLDLGDG